VQIRVAVRALDFSGGWFKPSRNAFFVQTDAYFVLSIRSVRLARTEDLTFRAAQGVAMQALR
jgi:hypothetical protein